HRLAKIHSHKEQFSLNYDPENKIIQWAGVTLEPLKEINSSRNVILTSDLIEVEISEPVDFYEQLELSGFVEVEISGLLSGLDVSYRGLASNGRSVIPTFRTVLINEFVINLQKSVESKLFSPRQHLYFPGVILDEMRIA